MMADLRARLKPLFRRSSTATTTSSKSSASSATTALAERRGHSKSSLLLAKTRKSSLPARVQEEDQPVPLPPPSIISHDVQSLDDPPQTPDTSFDTPRLTPLDKLVNPTLTVEEPTPDLTPAVPNDIPLPPSTSRTESIPPIPPLPRRQSLTSSNHSRFLHTLLESDKPEAETGASQYSEAGGATTVGAEMAHRKIWVKRIGQSATMVTISAGDLVDDAKDMILRKYANSLGRHYDAPDVTLRIVPRVPALRHGKTEQKAERTLGPEEQLLSILDAYFPGGQTVDDALIIDVPQRRTPRHSPRLPVPYYANDDHRPSESGADYFPTLPFQAQPSPRLPTTVSVPSGHGPSHPPTHSMSIVGTGQAPTLPSPGQLSSRHTSSSASRSQRPRIPRQHTASPTVLGLTKTTPHDSLKAHPSNIPAAPPLPSPQIPAEGQPHVDHAATPPRVASPRPIKAAKKTKKATSTLPAGLLDGAVPPINVLIVEDNIINLKLLEAFMKRLKVRWHTAMNGREAVNKWRQGGFHLVLMDIQLPVMNGLDATKEIRRLERVNKIGVFSNSAVNTPTFANSIDAVSEEGDEEASVPKGDDSLMNTALFKSPVIIVALTASSLQSDRHEALAAGPVNFVWLERKVMEWGCMQALIDFDGWRKWKDFSSQAATAAAVVAAAQLATGGKQASPGGSKGAANGAGVGGGAAATGAANGAIKGVAGKKNLALLTTGSAMGMGGKKEGSTSGSGSEGSGSVAVGV